MRKPAVLSVVASLAAALVLSGCASQATQVALQRPDRPTGQAFEVPAHHRLRGAVTIDYISGMSEYSYVFAEANRRQFRPMLEDALRRSKLLAKSPVAARYALQIEFVDLEGSFFGTDFDSRSRAIYRIVDRRTGGVISQQEVDAGFMARFVGLTEEDAVAAYFLTTTTARIGLSNYVGADDQRAAWRGAYQATLWASLFGLLPVIHPLNYVAQGDTFGNYPARRPHVLNGDLSTEGYGSRSGRERGVQADRQMLRQSIAKFFIGLAEEQAIPMTVILPCGYNAEIEYIKVDLAARGIPYAGENCRMTPMEIIR
ncbi:hypothetical protein ACIQC9_08600 [Brevundimonas sp. NPDC092305]|uniref:hypothetical protein n=1 Tax=Brevundimonas sp. NPDC092305 TaxID=3363957 RepID=UPI0037F54650